MSKLRKSVVETRLAASLPDPAKLRDLSRLASAQRLENSGFVSGHRFSDAATRHLLTAPLGAEGLASKLRKLSPIILTLALFSAALALAGEASPNSNSNSNDQLPAGPAKEKAEAACLTCHEARIIVQQRLSKPAWTNEVNKMMKWGAEVDSKDRDALIDYFSANFGPDQPAYVAPRSTTPELKRKNRQPQNTKNIQFREPRTENREPRTENREPRTEKGILLVPTNFPRNLSVRIAHSGERASAQRSRQTASSRTHASQSESRLHFLP